MSSYAKSFLQQSIGTQAWRISQNANGENPKVIQEFLRHANLKVTIDTYVQAVNDQKRKAQSKVVEMVLPGIRKRSRLVLMAYRTRCEKRIPCK